MGVNNKARRAAKRRKDRTRGREFPTGKDVDGGYDAASGRDVARTLLRNALHTVHVAPDLAAERAQQLIDSGVAAQVAGELTSVLADAIAVSVQRCWTPADLGEITLRRLSTRHVGLVAALLAELTNRHRASAVSQAWRDELDAIGPAQRAELGHAAGLQQALEVAALLETLPPIADVMPPPGAARRTRTGAGAPSAVLTKVRALLAKAESTEFPEEAEALSAKAQELIATYALDRYAAQLDAAEPDREMTVRRLWVDPPYVDAKAMLVDAVAAANHCRSVLSSYLGFVTLVGRASDVEASELLVTSLQVQADRAMLRHGRSVEVGRTSRTRSFRRSFLVSYAMRIEERLRQAADDTLAASTRSSELVPVLARSDERVRTVTEELFPQLVTRRTTVSNHQGWTAGRAAADLARFDVHAQVSDQAAG